MRDLAVRAWSSHWSRMKSMRSRAVARPASTHAPAKMVHPPGRSPMMQGRTELEQLATQMTPSPSLRDEGGLRAECDDELLQWSTSDMRSAVMAAFDDVLLPIAIEGLAQPHRTQVQLRYMGSNGQLTEAVHVAPLPNPLTWASLRTSIVETLMLSSLTDYVLGWWRLCSQGCGLRPMQCEEDFESWQKQRHLTAIYVMGPCHKAADWYFMHSANSLVCGTGYLPLLNA